MARAKGKPRGATPAGRRPTVVRHVLRIGLTLAVAAAALAGMIWLGTRATEQVADHPRFAVKFADIRCDAPPGGTRETFLSEVRYLSQLPETVPAVDPHLGEKLTAGFALHPWVESVAGVDVSPDRQITVRIVFRTPVLLVRVKGQPAERIVDRRGVVLPPTMPPPGLAVLDGTYPPPASPAGQPWDSEPIRRAAYLAREYNAKRVEKTDRGWRITQRTDRVLVVSF